MFWVTPLIGGALGGGIYKTEVVLGLAYRFTKSSQQSHIASQKSRCVGTQCCLPSASIPIRRSLIQPQ
ncbi:MAG TPA: hypothetical protein VIX37_11750 [Candidatus Sulfotelmatobacter sp.]